MPTAPPHPCPRCRRALIPRGERHCGPCAARVEELRGSSFARGYDSAWRRLRAAHLAAHPSCADLSHAEPVRATDVDHKIAHRGDDALRLDPANLVSLCHACHSRKTVAVDGGFGRPKVAR